MRDQLGASVEAQRYIDLAHSYPGFFEPGLLEPSEVDAARSDPNTIFLPSAEVTKIPMAVPLEHNSWFTPEYFTGKVDPAKPLLYYAGWTGLAESFGADEQDTTDHLMQGVADANAALVFEQSPQRDARAVFSESLARLGLPHTYIEPVTYEKKGDTSIVLHPEHHMYVGQYSGGAREEPISNWFEAYAAMHDNSGQTRLKRQIDSKDTVELYDSYVAAFEAVERHDPYVNVVPKDLFDGWMNDPNILKAVHLGDDAIDNLAVVGTVQNFDWLNQTYLQQMYPDDYERDTIVSCPGVFTRKGAGNMLSLRTLGLVAKTFAAAGIAPKAVIECTSLSARQIPKMLELSTVKNGDSTIAVGAPVLTQSVQILTVGQNTS